MRNLRVANDSIVNGNHMPYQLVQRVQWTNTGGISLTSSSQQRSNDLIFSSKENQPRRDQRKRRHNRDDDPKPSRVLRQRNAADVHAE